MRAEELLHTRETILLDGAMGTMLQAAGLPLGAKPEALNIEDPALIESIHAQYAAAGSRILCANTFGASAHKLAGSGYTVAQVVAAGIGCARRAAEPSGALVALDIGPLGELLEPAGTLPFEDAVAAFAQIVRAGAEAGADLILCETFTDLYELKAALLACKETCALPVLASMSFEAGGRTFTGCTVGSFAATARGLGADALGIKLQPGPQRDPAHGPGPLRGGAGGLPRLYQAQRRPAPGGRQRLRHHPAAVRHADEALPGAGAVRGGGLLRHHPPILSGRCTRCSTGARRAGRPTPCPRCCAPPSSM